MKLNWINWFVPRPFSIAWTLLFLICLVVLACNSNISKTNKRGNIKINYTLNAWDLPTVVWLEDGDKNFVKTIYVSDWLSNDGHLLSYVCPQWSRVADWRNVPDTEIDAVTSATPVIGTHEIILNCTTEDISFGTYHYSVETHIQNKYNILYTGQITVGNASNSSMADVNYIPEAHPDSIKRNVLSEVAAIYQFID